MFKCYNTQLNDCCLHINKHLIRLVRRFTEVTCLLYCTVHRGVAGKGLSGAAVHGGRVQRQNSGWQNGSQNENFK